LNHATDDSAIRSKASHFGTQPAQTLFDRPEDDVHRAIDIARDRQISGGTRQHGGVVIATAGMHATRMLRTMPH
jgi:hypothetical protein